MREPTPVTAHGREMQIFVGHSYEMEGAPPYVAFVEILESALARAPSPQAFRQDLGEEAAEVAKLIPKLRRLCPDIPPPLELPAEQERRYLFNSIREVLARTAQRRSVLLVLDDLQWADDPTLLLVEHLAERLSELPVLVVATYRDTEVDVGRPLAKTFEDLRRRPGTTWMSLKRFPEEAVAEMLRAMSGQEAPAPLVRALYGETEGNPFFLEEVYKHLVEEGRLFDVEGRFRADLEISELDVPEGVRLAVGRRLQRLGENSMRVLAGAAVLGRAFSFELLEAMGDADPDTLLDAVEDAERARLIVSVPDFSSEDRFLFAHELIRQTLVAELSPPRRRRLHARAANAMERHYTASLDEHAAAIAHHLQQAGAPGDRIFRYLVLAGKWALEGAAFEEALRHYEAASSLQEAVEPAQRAALLFELGTARRSAGHWATAIDAWRQSLDAYEGVGDEEAIGRVCLAASYNLMLAARFVEAVEMTQRGLAALGDRISSDRGRLLGMTGMPAAYGGDYEASAGMIDEALTLAAQLGDDVLLGHGLMCKAMARVAFMEFRDAAEAGLRAAELLRAAGDLWSVTSALAFLLDGLPYLGRLDEARQIIQELSPLAERVGNHSALLLVGRMNNMIGFFVSPDLDRLEAFARHDRELCESAGWPWISNSWAWLGLAQFLRGDWEEARTLFEEAVRLEPPGALCGWNAALLFECLAYLGERSEALALLEPRDLPRPGQPKPSGAAAMLASAVEGLTVLGERDRASDFYSSVIDCFERTGVLCLSHMEGGLLERAAGIAAMAGRRFEESEAHFLRALEQAESIPHRPEQAHTRRWYGQMLLERDGPGDRQQAEQVLRQAIADYERMGMRRHRELAASLLH